MNIELQSRLKAKHKNSTRSVLIVGAGISGLTLAALLSDLGYRVKIVEKRPDPRTSFEEGRSINFTITGRGMFTLKQLGVDVQVLNESVRVSQRVVHLQTGHESTQQYGTNSDHVLYAIRRQDLLLILLENSLKKINVEIEFNAQIVEIDREQPLAVVRATNQPKNWTEKADFIVGADGSFSTVRQYSIKREPVSFYQKFFDWSYQELFFNQQDARSLGLHANSLHIWPNSTGMLVAMPNLDDSFSVLYITAFPQTKTWKSTESNLHFTSEFMRMFPEIYKSVPSLQNQIKIAPVNSLVTTGVSRWYYQDKVVLVGDACHSVFPFYGQGMNAALEDCLVLTNLLEQETNILQVFKIYEDKRKQSAEALTFLSSQHFYTLRDKSCSSFYIAKNLVDSWLSQVFPGLWYHEYQLIAHTQVPYEEALKKINRQEWLRRLLPIAILDLTLAGLISLQRAIAKIFIHSDSGKYHHQI